MSDSDEPGTNEPSPLRIEELLVPTAFPHAVSELRLVETRVVPITRQNSQAHIAGAGKPIEYAVCLKQFSPGQQLPALLERGEVTSQEITQLAETLADFHLRPPESSGSQ